MKKITNYSKLLKKYSKPTAGERYSNQYKIKLRMEQRVKHRHLLLDGLVNEVPFKVTAHEKERVKYLINTFTDFKSFHRRASNEAILLAFIFLLKTIKNPKTNVEEFTISKKYGLTNPMFRLIICRLCDQLSQMIPLAHNSASKGYL